MRAAVWVAVLFIPGIASAELPLLEVPAHGPAKAIAVIYSGDGGWWGFENGLAKDISDKGIVVVGWNTLKYFWTRRTPQQAADDLSSVLDRVSAAQGALPIVLVGYSYGADVLPFIVEKLPPRIASRVERVALINPGHNADLVFHFSSWAGDYAHSDSLKVLDGIGRLRAPVVCACGESDSDCCCRESKARDIRILILPGGHRLKGDHAHVAEAILK